MSLIPEMISTAMWKQFIKNNRSGLLYAITYTTTTYLGLTLLRVPLSTTDRDVVVILSERSLQMLNIFDSSSSIGIGHQTVLSTASQDALGIAYYALSIPI